MEDLTPIKPTRIHKGGRPKRTIQTTEIIKQEIMNLFNSGLDSTQDVLTEIRKKYPDTGKFLVNAVKQEHRLKTINELPILTQTHYVKDSLIEYDRIIDNAKYIEEKSTSIGKYITSLEAQRNIINSLKDRNSLLGLDNANPVITINFEANVSDAEFLNRKQPNQQNNS